MKRFVIGDIHGTHKAMLDCFKRSNFDYENDQLICLGDVADGYPDVYECFEELFKIKNLIYVIGNHDYWLYEWFRFGWTPNVWTSQGGKNSIKSYNIRTAEEINNHADFLGQKTLNYYVDSDNRVFVHGGFIRELPIDKNDKMVLMWDRNLIQKAASAHPGKVDLKTADNFKEIFVGHTTTQLYQKVEPIHLSNLWMLDTGAGWSGKLTIMDVDTKEYWQSDYSETYYPGHTSRG